MEDNQAGHGKRSWAHISVYIGALLYWSFWKKNKKDIINVQRLWAAFIFWDIFGTPSKAFNWNVKQLYNIFLYVFYPIFNVSSYFKLGYKKYRLSKIHLLWMSPHCSFLILRVFIWNSIVLIRQLWKWQLISMRGLEPSLDCVACA